MAVADGTSDGAGVTSERPEAAAVTTDERVESEQSGSDEDGDGESSTAESEPSTAEFKQPRAHQRRRIRANKRNVERGSTGTDSRRRRRYRSQRRGAMTVHQLSRAKRAPPTTDELTTSAHSLSKYRGHRFDLFRPHVTLTFDLLTTKVVSFISFARRPRLPICIKIGSFVFQLFNGHRDL